MKLRDLFVRIGFDVDDKDLKSLDKGLKQTKGLVLALGAAATASAGFLVGLAKSVADVGDSIAKTAGRMGINLELLQEYQYAAQLAGMGVDELNSNMEQYIRRNAEAVQGTGESVDAYKELGISLKDAAGKVKSTDQLLAETADRFAEIEDGSTKVRIAYDLFGRSGIGMINMLNQGSAAIAAQRQEARDLGVVLDEKTARAAEKFQDDLLRAKSVITGIKNQVGGELLPTLTNLLVRFREWVLLNREMIKTRLDAFIKKLIGFIGGLYQMGLRMVGVLGDIIDLFGGIEAAATVAAIAMGLFVGAQVFLAIGNMATGIVTLTKAIKGMGTAALLANVKLMAIPLLIGAAVAAAILIIQDIVSFFQGKDSVTGVIVDAFEKYVPAAVDFAVKWMREKIAPVVDWIGERVEWVKQKIEAMKEALKKPVEAVKNFMGTMGENVALSYGAYGYAGVSVPVPTSGSSRGNSYSKVDVNAPVTVTVPADTPAEMVGAAVQQGVSDGISRMLRDASLATEPKVVE